MLGKWQNIQCEKCKAHIKLRATRPVKAKHTCKCGNIIRSDGRGDFRFGEGIIRQQFEVASDISTFSKSTIG